MQLRFNFSFSFLIHRRRLTSSIAVPLPLPILSICSKAEQVAATAVVDYPPLRGGVLGKLPRAARESFPLWTRISFLWFQQRHIPRSLYIPTPASTFFSTCTKFSSSSALRSRDGSITCANFTKTYDQNLRMRDLARRVNIPAARKVFDEIPERDKVSYASMVSIYLKGGDFQKAERVFCEIPAGMRGVVVDSAMVHAYAEAGRMDRAKQVFDEMPERNAFSWTSLISGYLNNGRVDEAFEEFERMPERLKNVVTWTNMIVGLGRNGLVDEARAVFGQMPVKNVVSFTAMIKVLIDNGLVGEAFKLFLTMPHHNAYSWITMIDGLLNANRLSEAKHLFDSMSSRNAVSWTVMVTGLARNGMIELARKYFDRMPVRDVSAWNAMITAYTDKGLMGEASELFKSMASRNIVTWNAILSGHAKNQQDGEVFRHFLLMVSTGIKPNDISLTCLLTSCHGIHEVLQVHGLVVRLGFEAEASLTNTLITMYYRTGDVISARIAFDNLEAKDVVSWTAMILAYSNHGFGLQALQTFGQMLRTGNKPDEITFTGVLSACSHAGLVKKGQMLFTSMTSYGLEPMPEHYSCLVDLLGRAGMVKEATNVVREMRHDKLDSVVLGALVGACRLCGDDELAEQIGGKMIELKPGQSGGYVLLANVYAASGKWKKYSDLWKKMKERDVTKVPGFSEIQVNGKSHVFLARDKLHPEIEEIRSLLDEKLVPAMQGSFETNHCFIT